MKGPRSQAELTHLSRPSSRLVGLTAGHGAAHGAGPPRKGDECDGQVSGVPVPAGGHRGRARSPRVLHLVRGSMAPGEVEPT